MQRFAEYFARHRHCIMAIIKTTSKTIVLIHGLFVNGGLQAGPIGKLILNQRVFLCYTPANPFHEGDPKDLRIHIDPKLAKVTFEDIHVLNDLQSFISTLPEKPIIIGHSLAGANESFKNLISMDKAVAGRLY